MYTLLIKTILAVSLLDLGISAVEIRNCSEVRKPKCLNQILEKPLKIKWKTIIIFQKPNK